MTEAEKLEAKIAEQRAFIDLLVKTGKASEEAFEKADAARLHWLERVGVETKLAMEQEAALADLLAACKQWKQATESRLRLVSNREMSDVLLPPDAALFEAINRAAKDERGS